MPIKWIDKEGKIHKLKSRIVRYSFDSEAERRGEFKMLGDGFLKTNYTGMVSGMQNEVRSIVWLNLKTGRIFESKYFSRADRDYVVKESVEPTCSNDQSPRGGDGLSKSKQG